MVIQKTTEKRVTVVISKQIREQYQKLKQMGYRDADIFKAGIEYLTKKEEIEANLFELIRKVDSIATNVNASMGAITKITEELVKALTNAQLIKDLHERMNETSKRLSEAVSRIETHDVIIVNALDSIQESLKSVEKMISNDPKKIVKEKIIEYYSNIMNILKEKGIYTLVAEDLAKLQNEFLKKYELLGD